MYEGIVNKALQDAFNNLGDPSSLEIIYAALGMGVDINVTMTLFELQIISAEEHWNVEEGIGGTYDFKAQETAIDYGNYSDLYSDDFFVSFFSNSNDNLFWVTAHINRDMWSVMQHLGWHMFHVADILYQYGNTQTGRNLYVFNQKLRFDFSVQMIPENGETIYVDENTGQEIMGVKWDYDFLGPNQPHAIEYSVFHSYGGTSAIYFGRHGGYPMNLDNWMDYGGLWGN